MPAGNADSGGEPGRGRRRKSQASSSSAYRCQVAISRKASAPARKSHGSLRHGAPVTRRGHRLQRLVGRLGGRDQVEAGEGEALPDLDGHAEVPVVERVEGPPEEGDAGATAVHYCRTWPSPKATNFVVVSSERPMGPKAWILVVLIPISAPSPSW